MIATLVLAAAAPAGAGLPDFTAVVEQVTPAVVNVSTVRDIAPIRVSGGDAQAALAQLEAAARPGGAAGRETISLGSGLIVSHDGLVLTNHHIIEGASEVRVQLANGARHLVDVVGTDPASDLALLRIPGVRGLPVLEVAPRTARRLGAWVLAIAAPTGLEQSVSVGVISATARTLPEGTIPFIRTDLNLDPSGSGSPLFDAEGRAVGVISTIYGHREGLRGPVLAIPMELALLVAERIAAQGRVGWGWVGISLGEPVWREGSHAGGAVVTAVQAGGPADVAGLEPGDRIVAFEEQLVRRASDLLAWIAAEFEGSEVSFGVIRDGHLLELRATLGEPPTTGGEGMIAVPGYGLVLRDLGPAEASRLALADDGVLVVEVGEGTAGRAGLLPGDTILLVADRPVTDAMDLARQLHGLAPGTPIPVLIERRGAPLFLPLAAPR